MRARNLLPVSAIALFALAAMAALAEAPYFELSHASNARATDRNLGRNFLHLGRRFENGLIVSGGAYVAGEKYCFESLTFGYGFTQQRWEVTMTAHAGGVCAIDGRRIAFGPNVGLCGLRLLANRPLWSAGIGACLWRQADYTIGDYATIPNDPARLRDSGVQPTAQLLIRFKPGNRSPRRP